VVPGALALLLFGCFFAAVATAQDQPAPDMSPLPPGTVQRSDPPDLMAVTKGIMCRCGCSLTVYACQASMTCQVSTDMRLQAKAMLDKGMTVQQALDAFAADYGEEVLAAPTKTGFNLAAWVMPFAALAVGLAVVAFAIRTWRPKAAPAGDVPPVEVDPKWASRVEDELGRED
jgi:cytochrome c-type biogenesis protein CcmH